MVYETSNKIAEALKAKNLNCRIEESETASSVAAKLSGEHAKDLIIRFISHNDGNDVSVRIFAIADGSKSDKVKLLTLLNKLNSDYRFACFYLADNGEISVSYDVPSSADQDLGGMCVELLIRLWRIVDEAYPAILAAANL